MAQRLSIDRDYIQGVLQRLLEIPSPTGFTDNIVHAVCNELSALGVGYELTRRGAIRGNIRGRRYSPDRAIIGHLDTIGAMVKGLKGNGRLEVVPIGTWSARFAEGARVTVFTDEEAFRGTILPLKSSGHVYDAAVDEQPVSWENLEVRVDARCHSLGDLLELGFHVGDYIAVDPQPEFSENGFINSRHLDDKAGVAAILAAAKAVVESGQEIPLDCHLLLTISEEVGVGASHVLHGDVAEMVSIDNGTLAPGQNTSEYGATVTMQDSSGPFDYHLTHNLLELCREHQIVHSRDIFKYYRSDSAAALEAGNDIRTALVCFAVDASHGWERTHMDSLAAVAQLLAVYMQAPAAFQRDKAALGPLSDFPHLDVPEHEDR